MPKLLLLDLRFLPDGHQLVGDSLDHLSRVLLVAATIHHRNGCMDLKLAEVTEQQLLLRQVVDSRIYR